MAYKLLLNGPGEGMMTLRSGYAARQPWAWCTIRKPVRCEVTATTIPKGARAWRPITNGRNRMHRISEEGMRRLAIDDQIR